MQKTAHVAELARCAWQNCTQSAVHVWVSRFWFVINFNVGVPGNVVINMFWIKVEVLFS